MHWRKLIIATHRDVGYFFAGLTVIYAVSGVALNHIDDWNPNYVIRTEVAEVGVLPFGDAAGALGLLDEVARGTPLGRLIASGAETFGRAYGVTRVPTVKGQAMPAYDPRAIKGIGVTYATTPQGADHTAGLIVNPGLTEDQWAQSSQEIQLINAVTDSSGFCQFLQPTLDGIREFYGLLYGEEVGREEIADQGWQCLEDEWEFNRRAGLDQADDDLPECLREEGIGPDRTFKFDVGADVIKQARVRFPTREELFTKPAAG